jgi:hypothetical protein
MALAFVAVMLSNQNVNAQDMGPAVAGALAAGALQQGTDLLRQAPEQLEGLLETAGKRHEFETEKSCLAHLQLAAQFAALARNTMPFSDAWTLEDERGPVVKLRVMLGGDRTHVELSCDKKLLRAEVLPWGEGSSEESQLQMSTLDAGLGALFVLHGEGAFEENPEVTSVDENGSQSSGVSAAHSPQDLLPQGARVTQAEASELERRQQSLAEEIADLEKEVAVAEQRHADIKQTLAGITIQGARYYWSDDSFISQPTIEFTVRNETKLPIRKLFAQGVVISPGRTLPWVDEEFNYEFPGGLEPSEERHLRLAPNTFGEWGNRDLSDRDDLVLTIVITGLEDAEGRVVEDEGKDRELELRQRLSTLAAQRETILRSTGGVSGDVLSTGPSGVSTDGVGPPLTSNEKDAFRLAAQRCWNVPAGLRDSLGSKVTVGAELAVDGTLVNASIELVEPNPAPDGPTVQLFEATRRALIRCSPFIELPREKYAQWRYIEVVANPEGIVSW